MAAVLTLAAAAALAAVAIGSAAEREETLRNSYGSATVLVRDRLVTEIGQLESRLEQVLADTVIPAGVGGARSWLDRIAAAHPWIADPFVVDSNGGVLTRDAALAWLQGERHHAVVQPRVAALLARAERAELTGGDLDRALRLYGDGLRAAGDPASRAAARMRIARVLYKRRQFEAGIEAYRRLSGAGPDLTDATGVPIAVRALDQIAAGHEALNQPAARDAARDELRRHVLRHPWDLEHGYEYYLARAGIDRRRDEIDHIRRLRADLAPVVLRQIARVSSAARRAAEPEAVRPPLYWRRVEIDGVRHLSAALTYRISEEHLAGSLLSRVLDTVQLARDVRIELLESDTSVTPLASAPLHIPGVQLTVSLLHRQGWSMPQLIARDRMVYGSLVGGMLAVLVLGVALAVRASARETELARLRTEFVANVSHELKTPLALIRLYAETLESGLVSDPVRTADFSAVIRRESDRLTHLINNVLDTAKIEAGTKQYHFARVDIAALVREALDAYRPFLTRLGFVVEASLPDAPVTLWIDRDAIVQALVNLLHNAAKYAGDVKHVVVTLEALPHEARLSVADRGIGIAPSEQSRIFEKYYRVHGAASGAATGSGLGLSIVAHAMAAHGGQVRVESVYGAGSNFRLVFPVETVCRES